MSHLIEDQIVNLRVIINGFLDEIINISRTKLEEEGEDTSEEKMFDKMQEILIYFDHQYSSAEKCAEFKDYTIENFKEYVTTVITEILNELLHSKLCPKGFLKLFIMFILLTLKLFSGGMAKKIYSLRMFLLS